jgi:hypothetical protein
MTKPGVERYDEEGNDKTWEDDHVNDKTWEDDHVNDKTWEDDHVNDKTWEDDHVTEYWLKHYLKDHNCALCDQSGTIKVKSGSHFCICPNGQVGRWLADGGKIKPLWLGELTVEELKAVAESIPEEYT